MKTVRVRAGKESFVSESTRALLEDNQLAVEIDHQRNRPSFAWNFAGFKSWFPMDQHGIALRIDDDTISVKQAMRQYQTDIDALQPEAIAIYPVYGTIKEPFFYTLKPDEMPVNGGRFLGFAYYLMTDTSIEWKTADFEEIWQIGFKNICDDLMCLADWRNKKLLKVELLSDRQRVLEIREFVQSNATDVSQSINSCLKAFLGKEAANSL